MATSNFDSNSNKNSISFSQVYHNPEDSTNLVGKNKSRVDEENEARILFLEQELALATGETIATIPTPVAEKTVSVKVDIPTLVSRADLSKSSPSNPCPVCDRTNDGDCRILKSAVLCHTYADAKVGFRINGFVCTKLAVGHTATFVEATEPPIEKAQPQQALPAQVKKQRPIPELSLSDRHEQYQEILNNLSLSHDHEVKLKARGYTQEYIEKFQFKSAEREQWVGIYAPNLSGVTDGKLNIGETRIIFPVTNQDGLITHLSSHPDFTKNGKYKPLSSFNNSPHLEGEIGIGYYEPEVNLLPGIILLPEGFGFKDKLACQRLGARVVSASGGQSCASPNLLKKTLEAVTKPGDTHVLCPDAGDVKNKPCLERWIKTARLLREFGYSPKIAWWGQYTKKENPDIDEIADFSEVQLLEPEEFEKICKHEYEQFCKERDSKKRLEDFNNNFAIWKNSRKFTPTKTINQKYFEFGAIPDSNCLVAAKSDMGTGKTSEMIKIIKQKKRGAVLLSSRNNLLYNTIGRAYNEGVTIYHINEEDGSIDMTLDSSSVLAMCVDSAHKVDGYFRGKDLYIDEIMSVIYHIICGGTLEDRQAEAIEIISRAFRECNNIYILDGNLTDIIADFIHALAPERQLIKIENLYKSAPHKITIIDGIDVDGEIKKYDKSPLIKQILEPGQVSAIMTDSRMQSEVTHQLLSEMGVHGYVIHGGTVGEDWAKEFLNDPDDFIKKYQPKYIIFSPSCESGIDVSIRKYFTQKFSSFCGVLNTKTQHQMMFRVRDESIPHYVFCPPTSMVQKRDEPQTLCFAEYVDYKESKIIQSASRAGLSASKALNLAAERQKKLWWDLALELGMLDVFEQQNLRACLMYSITDAGHQVEEVQWDTDIGVQELVKKAKSVVTERHAREVAAADEFESLADADKAAKSNPRLEVQRKIEKTRLLNRLPGIKENPIWGENFILNCHVLNADFISKQQIYFLLKNPEIAEKRHEIEWFHATTKKEAFFKGRVAKMRGDIIWALNELNISELETLEYSKDSPEVLNIIEKLRTRKDIRTALNIDYPPKTVSNKNHMEVVNRLLGVLGFRNQFLKQERNESGVRTRYYTAVPEFEIVSKKKGKGQDKDKDVFNFKEARLAVLSCIETKMKQWLETTEKPDWDISERQEIYRIYSEAKVKLHKEWELACEVKEKADWLKPDSVKDTAEILRQTEDYDMFKELEITIPAFAIRAAISTLSDEEIARLVSIGAENIPKDIYKMWRPETVSKNEPSIEPDFK